MGAPLHAEVSASPAAGTAASKPAVAIVDYGMGNLRSVANAIQTLGHSPRITRDVDAVASAQALVLPGVGAFNEAMNRLEALGLVAALTRRVIDEATPFLGICLGMQLCAERSTEGGFHVGLGWVKGRVELIAGGVDISLPHVGWNDVHWTEGENLFRNVAPGANFFFDHSYTLDCDAGIVAGTVDYGGAIVAAIRKDNIFATQFHPERSQNNGLRVLRNFLNHVDGGA